MHQLGPHITSPATSRPIFCYTCGIACWLALVVGTTDMENVCQVLTCQHKSAPKAPGVKTSPTVTMLYKLWWSSCDNSVHWVGCDTLEVTNYSLLLGMFCKPTQACTEHWEQRKTVAYWTSAESSTYKHKTVHSSSVITYEPVSLLFLFSNMGKTGSEHLHDFKFNCQLLI